MSRKISQSRVVVAKAREMAERIAASEGLEVVEAEWKGALRGGVLRVYIDKPMGITHADCELVSRQLSAALDVEDLTPANYSLEVSSPGLDRKIRGASDFQRFAGCRAKVRLRDPVDGTRSVTGRIEQSSHESVSLRTANGEALDIPFAAIEVARLVADFSNRAAG